MVSRILFTCVVLGLAVTLGIGQPAATKSPREALQPFGDLIGAWNGTGTPTGSRDDVQRNFWTEKMDWGWQFKGKDAWLQVKFEKSKHFLDGELRYVPDKDHYALTLTTLKKEKITYVGALDKRKLTLQRQAGKESERLIFTFLHSNRFLYSYAVVPQGRVLPAIKWTVGATKEGEPFAVGTGKPECVVSGVTASTAVSYMGKTYYVCCSGCRDEFNASPAKYVAEYEANLKKKKK